MIITYSTYLLTSGGVYLFLVFFFFSSSFPSYHHRLGKESDITKRERERKREPHIRICRIHLVLTWNVIRCNAAFRHRFDLTNAWCFSKGLTPFVLLPNKIRRFIICRGWNAEYLCIFIFLYPESRYLFLSMCVCVGVCVYVYVCGNCRPQLVCWLLGVFVSRTPHLGHVFRWAWDQVQLVSLPIEIGLHSE